MPAPLMSARRHEADSSPSLRRWEAAGHCRGCHDGRRAVQHHDAAQPQRTGQRPRSHRPSKGRCPRRAPCCVAPFACHRPARGGGTHPSCSFLRKLNLHLNLNPTLPQSQPEPHRVAHMSTSAHHDDPQSSIHTQKGERGVGFGGGRGRVREEVCVCWCWCWCLCLCLCLCLCGEREREREREPTDTQKHRNTETINADTHACNKHPVPCHARCTGI